MTESIWLRRAVKLALRSEELRPRGEAAAIGPWETRRRLGRKLTIGLRPEDRLLLSERAAGRGMAAATYVSVLVRSHLRGLTPLPKEELAALKLAVSELSAVGRNLNQIARVANEGARVGGAGREEFKAMIKLSEAMRDHIKNLVKANTASWEAGHAAPAD
jgi:Bacterial mobilisation protein (MobC)